MSNVSSESSSEVSEKADGPKLQYSRLKGDLPCILGENSATCVAVHPKFLAVGTELGLIHILDHEGNSVSGLKFTLHDSAINQISIDNKGNFLASCSNDGKAIVYGLHSKKIDMYVTTDTPIFSIALDPNFCDGKVNRRFIIGESKALLYEKSLWTGYRITSLREGKGNISDIQWKKRFVAWADDNEVVIYDMKSHCFVSVMKKDIGFLTAPKLRCNFLWNDVDTLLTGWDNSIKVCKVKPFEEAGSSHYLQFRGEITAVSNIDSDILGISCSGDHIVALISLENSKLPGKIGLEVLETGCWDATLISRDVLTLPGSEDFHCHDYRLGSLPEEGLYFIWSPKDIIVAKLIGEDHAHYDFDHTKNKEITDSYKLTERKEPITSPGSSGSMLSGSVMMPIKDSSELKDNPVSFPTSSMTESQKGVYSSFVNSNGLTAMQTAYRCQNRSLSDQDRHNETRMLDIQQKILNRLDGLTDLVNEGNQIMRKIAQLKQLELQIKYHELNLDFDKLLKQ